MPQTNLEQACNNPKTSLEFVLNRVLFFNINEFETSSVTVYSLFQDSLNTLGDTINTAKSTVNQIQTSFKSISHILRPLCIVC